MPLHLRAQNLTTILGGECCSNGRRTERVGRDRVLDDKNTISWWSADIGSGAGKTTSRAMDEVQVHMPLWVFPAMRGRGSHWRHIVIS